MQRGPELAPSDREPAAKSRAASSATREARFAADVRPVPRQEHSRIFWRRAVAMRGSRRAAPAQMFQQESAVGTEDRCIVAGNGGESVGSQPAQFDPGGGDCCRRNVVLGEEPGYPIDIFETQGAVDSASFRRGVECRHQAAGS